jgi:hypothetical protein
MWSARHWQTRYELDEVIDSVRRQSLETEHQDDRIEVYRRVRSANDLRNANRRPRERLTAKSPPAPARTNP